MPPEPPATTLLLTAADTGELAARRWRIEVIAGPDRGRAIDREGGTIIVGTHPDTDLALTDGTVSRYHVELRLLAEGVLLRDLDTTNGTKVGGVRVASVLLTPRATCSLGHTTLRVVPDDRPVELGHDDPSRFGAFVTQAPALRRILAQLQRVATTEATVLLQGETGTGKEVLARAIHAASPRGRAPFVVVDCASVAATLVESELFGHVRGSFTGAVTDRAGAFEAARGGTVFLDEIGELAPDLQAKLLRVLEARTIRRVGETVERPVDVRFVAATHRDLKALADRGGFRADLYYRIAVVSVLISPLRERPEDLAPLARAFALRLKPDAELTDAAVAALGHYDWPGNARELRNVVERALALAATATITAADLFGAPAAAAPAAFHAAKEEVIREFEARYVRRLLALCQGNISQAAAKAGLSRNAFYALMRRTGVETPDA
ncbi:MAG: sigma 54-dependent Fis family transcriptional regulator [Deltaproteobacteria bacterium]|nr:sigma 54-dependent Fis family transcriptional regulator [Deltaproteobacteria bacterium]